LNVTLTRPLSLIKSSSSACATLKNGICTSHAQPISNCSFWMNS
jgi:hypothetical protein